MRCLAVLGALFLLATVSVARAQIQVTSQMARSTFLLYERVDLLVTIQNIGSNDLVLDNNEGSPWLSFLVSKHNRLPVRRERESTFPAVALKAGETKTLAINLTPLFSFREEGQYSAEAVVDLPGQGQMISDPVPFTVMKGNTVWSQLRPVDSSQRTYSLIRFSPTPDTTQLYLRVEDSAENIVYTNLSLGEMVSSVDPEVNFDPQGDLHILQPVALGTYLYTRADSSGKIMVQRMFKTASIQEASGSLRVPPRLHKLEDGNVTVIGGVVEDPNAPRERLSEAQAPRRALPAGLSAAPSAP